MIFVIQSVYITILYKCTYKIPPSRKTKGGKTGKNKGLLLEQNEKQNTYENLCISHTLALGLGIFRSVKINSSCLPSRPQKYVFYYGLKVT